MEDLHVYLRSITPGERTSLSVLASLVHNQATVLDLGCGSGALGQHLSETRGCTLDGVTLSEAEATHARPHYRRVVVDNLESCDLVATFAGSHYDFIVCADVLEHLSRPEQVLAACRQLLQPEGRLLISVPNAGYTGLIAELLEGEFLYREEGLLDRTHLRFFTRRSLARFLGEQRWAIDSVDTIARELPESEFDAAFDRLPPSVARHLLGAPDALSYQFICMAHPVAATQPAWAPSTTPAAPAQARFTAQLYLGHDGHYSEARKLTASGVIGQERQTLRFELPSQHMPVTQLRLDPADRPGFVHLYRLALRSADGATLWQWSADTDPRSLLAATPHSQIVWQAPLPPAAGATLLLLAGDEPWFELPIAATVLTACPQEGTTLEVELGWPMSADYVALSGTVRPLHDRIAQLESDCRDAASRLNHVQTDLAAAQNRSQLLEEANQATARQRATWQQEATRLQNDLAELSQHLHTIETSTVFRATRPIVHAKMRLDRLLGRSQQPSPHAEPAITPTPITPPQHPVDIIVPVYRGLADTRLCIDSVLASTNQSAWRLVVINDASPEPEVTAWLRERAAQDSRITLLENPDNLGFVGTVNRGMALSDSNDVLLLNSDTEVANDWLDRIRSAAYGDSKVASVTPFSNNATICSYPRFCKDNACPPATTPRGSMPCAHKPTPARWWMCPPAWAFACISAATAWRRSAFSIPKTSAKATARKTTSASAQQRPAGATCTCSTRLCCTPAASALATAKARASARHGNPAPPAPALRKRRDGLRAGRPGTALPPGAGRGAHHVPRRPAPVVLAVLHDRAGGTVRHVRELAQHLSEQAIFLTLTPAPDRCVRLELAGKDEGFQLVFRLADQYQDLVQALTQLGVRHIHYHHLLGHDPLIMDLPPQLGVGYDFTAHDFYSYCTHISMTGSDNRYAGEAAPGLCACCSPQDPAPVGGGTVADWRHRNRHFLTGARLVLAPSHDTAQRMAAFAPGARVRAIPHTDMSVPDLATQPQPQARPLPAGAPLKIVVLGALSAIKGADLLEAVALEAARRNAPSNFTCWAMATATCKPSRVPTSRCMAAMKTTTCPAFCNGCSQIWCGSPPNGPKPTATRSAPACRPGCPWSPPTWEPSPNGWRAAPGAGWCAGTCRRRNTSTCFSPCARSTLPHANRRSPQRRQAMRRPVTGTTGTTTLLVYPTLRRLSPCQYHLSRNTCAFRRAPPAAPSHSCYRAWCDCARTRCCAVWPNGFHNIGKRG
jgi:2-polyprenyl-3-methyl-5-hydroxy-6-metoxy-1,4-benzoquinol methylase